MTEASKWLTVSGVAQANGESMMTDVVQLGANTRRCLTLLLLSACEWWRMAWSDGVHGRFRRLLLAAGGSGTKMT